MTQRWPLVLLLGSVVGAVGCSAPSSGAGADGGTDGGGQLEVDAGSDAGSEAASDAGFDAGMEAGPDGGVITHGMQLTLADVGPTVLGITSFTQVPGGTFTGTPLKDWGSLARTVGPGGETLDGFTFPEGTVVLERAELTSEVRVDSGWLVLRGCKGSLLLYNPLGDDGGGGALYSELTAFNSGGRKDGLQPVRTICHRCYFPHSGLENVYSDNVTLTESWISPDPGGSGDHVDGIQTWGGQSHLDFSRNHLQWNGDWNSTQSGLVGMYSDGSQGGYDGYDHVTVTNNYFVIGTGGGIGLHAPMSVPTSEMKVIGNRWKWEGDFGDPDYTPAVYRSSGAADYTKDGNAWSDNRWTDGPYSDQFLYPDNSTHPTEF